ncbi:MAG: acetate/propionate family kinase [Pigmentiphaga sp.]|nr:acetate/propionate family kinase [Pigmentiphaga sp.]
MNPAEPSPQILVANAGSSSLKFQLYVLRHGALALEIGGQISGIGTTQTRFAAADGHGRTLTDEPLATSSASNLEQAQAHVAGWLAKRMDRAPVAVGHRIVHGGPRYHDSRIITPEVLRELDALAPLAPLHQHNNLLPVHVIAERWPEIVQVACFDTAFHRGHAPEVERFALPERFYQQGVRRYGFHGLSYEYIAGELRDSHPEVGSRVVAAHLGSGASACALLDGRSVDTTMGFTALDGLPMGTRPGRLDPGVLLWMLEQGMDHDEIQRVLYYESGLKGLSGISGDVRDLEASAEPAARLALEVFARRTAEAVAGLGVSLGGLDALVFTAGVGEHNARVRARVCHHLAWLGLRLDDAANQRHARRIAARASAVDVLVIPTREEWVIARKTLETIGEASAPNG